MIPDFILLESYSENAENDTLAELFAASDSPEALVALETNTDKLKELNTGINLHKLVDDHADFVDVRTPSDSSNSSFNSPSDNFDPSNCGRPFMTCTWIGQSTCFIQLDRFNILTDPIFSPRTLGEWFGPKRLRPICCTLIQLPPIDFVLISHNHYDHLDLNVVLELGNSVHWFVPLGMRNWFNTHGVTNLTELDWWQSTIFTSSKGSLEITGAPVQHWSGRHVFDVNATLWCSFIVRGPWFSIFHCGDTGYCPVFPEIGEQYGPFDLALLRI